MKLKFETFLITALFFISCLGVALGDAPVLPGHLKKAEELIKTSSDIAIGKFTSLPARGTPDAPGSLYYGSVGVEIITALKGTITGTIQTSFSATFFPLSEKEGMPVIGTTYIMFIQKVGSTDYEIKKLLPATDDNVTKVKALIAAEPSGK